MHIAEIKVVGAFRAVAVRYINEDGGNHRRMYMPGVDASDAPEEVRSIVAASHTPDVIEAYRKHTEGNGNEADD
jgi:hypothetical protein